MESPHKLVSVLPKFNQMGHNPNKIVAFYWRTKSLEQKEWRLKNYCKILESRAVRYKQLLPLSGQIVRFGIGIGELSAFHPAVAKRVDTEKISYSRAAFALVDGIDTSKKLLDAKKQLNGTLMQIQMVNLLSGQQKDALNALMILQSYGVTDKEILNIYGFLNKARLEC